MPMGGMAIPIGGPITGGIPMGGRMGGIMPGGAIPMGIPGGGGRPLCAMPGAGRGTPPVAAMCVVVLDLNMTCSENVLVPSSL